MSKASKAVAKAQAKLEEARKYLQDCDKLRHGDYGHWVDNPNLQYVITKDKAGQLYYEWDESTNGHKTEVFDEQNFVLLGNIFDDSKRNSEDLEEFEHDNTKLSIDSDGYLRIEMAEYETRDLWHINDPKLVAQKILQMVATKERNA